MSTCTAVTHKTRKPCTREAVNGTVCELHGGLAPQTVRKAEIDRASRNLDGFITPIPLDDPEANPATGLYGEYRRAVARVRFLEDLLAETTDAEGLVWSKSREEHIGASEFVGVNAVFEAKTPVLIDLLHRERKHLLEVIAQMSKNAFKEAELSVTVQAVDLVHALSMELVVALGRRVDDPRVTRALERTFAKHFEAQDRAALSP